MKRTCKINFLCRAEELLLCSKFGPHPGGQGGLLFYVGVNGRYWFGVPDKQQKVEI